MYKKSDKMWGKKLKEKYSNEIRGLRLLLGVRYNVNKYTRLCKTHKQNRLMENGTTFQPCASHLTKK